jgi:hypothetical protein
VTIAGRSYGGKLRAVFRRVPTLLLAFAAWIAVSHSVPVHAQDTGARMARTTYLAGPSCPDESAFWTEVDAHRRNPETVESLSIRVEVSELHAGAQGRVTFVNERGVTSTRDSGLFAGRANQGLRTALP